MLAYLASAAPLDHTGEMIRPPVSAPKMCIHHKAMLNNAIGEAESSD